MKLVRTCLKVGANVRRIPRKPPTLSTCSVCLLCAYVESENPKGTFNSVLSWGAIGFVLTVLGCHLQYKYVKSQTEDK